MDLLYKYVDNTPGVTDADRDRLEQFLLEEEFDTDCINQDLDEVDIDKPELSNILTVCSSTPYIQSMH